MGDYLRTEDRISLALAVALSVQPDGHPSLSTSAHHLLVHSFHCHTVCNGFWIRWHHQDWLSLDKAIKNCFWWSKSGPAPFWFLLHMFWSSGEGGPCQMLFFQVGLLSGGLSPSYHTRAALFQRHWDLSLGNKFILVETFIESNVSQFQNYWHFGLGDSLSWGAVLCIVWCLAAFWSLPTRC